MAAINIIYSADRNWHTSWFRFEILLALAKAGHQVHYVAPQRVQDYALSLFRKKDQRDKPFHMIDYRPYLRLSKKQWQRELAEIRKMTGRLLDDRTIFISNDFKRCAAIKKCFGSRLFVVYDMYDRYSEYGNEQYTKAAAEIAEFDQLEREAAAQCDLVLCASQALLNDTLQWNASAIWFPNAVAQPCIAQPAGKKTDKILGMLSDRLSRFNSEVLIEIAQKLPSFTIELIGKNDLRQGVKYPANIVFKKYMPHNELLEYISRWRCGLSLYQADRFNDYCCPLKYFEYSSRNLPVITAAIPEGKVFAALYPENVYVAEDAQSFVQRINELAGRSDLVDFTGMARANTWEIRAEQLTDVLTGSRQR